MEVELGFIGEHAVLASEKEIRAGIVAAREVFARHSADPGECAAASGKLAKDELISREEARLCVIWDEADDTAFRAVTLGWLARDVDIWLAVK